MKINNQTRFLENLKLWGFKIKPFNKKIIGVKNLILNHLELEEKRKELAFDIDGIVYKVNEFALHQMSLFNILSCLRSYSFFCLLDVYR